MITDRICTGVVRVEPGNVKKIKCDTCHRELNRYAQSPHQILRQW